MLVLVLMQLHDLLCPSTPSSKLTLLGAEGGGVTVKGLREEPVTTAQQVRGGGAGWTAAAACRLRPHGAFCLPACLPPYQALALIASGEASRHVGATDLNATSSRSHTIFRMTITATTTTTNTNHR